MVAKAIAYMALNQEEMNEWYDYNKMMMMEGESLVAGLEKVPSACRCLPRHIKRCPDAEHTG